MTIQWSPQKGVHAVVERSERVPNHTKGFSDIAEHDQRHGLSLGLFSFTKKPFACLVLCIMSSSDINWTPKKGVQEIIEFEYGHSTIVGTRN
jgi:hypothetical protein